ncbi:MAG: biotin--[acetyl-CoA-carboxylase] ligase [Bacilli bacterium]|nr:biotin--[acetyl-CoA-carboxylase] ligase [Bacilli bacterium]
MNYHYIHFDEIDSTNNYLKNSYQLLDNFTFVSADYQNKGKGRNDRVWESNKGSNLMFSILIKDPKLIEISSLLSLYSAVEISKLLESFGINNVSIKWPNDVLVNDKKICGILLEGQLPNYVVIGIGLNVNQKEFPSNLRRPATSISNELNKYINLEELKETLFPSIVNNFNKLNKDDYLSYFNNHNYLLNKRVKVEINNQTFIGEVVDIDKNFNLQILSHDILLHIDSGEIEIL